MVSPGTKVPRLSWWRALAKAAGAAEQRRLGSSVRVDDVISGAGMAPWLPSRAGVLAAQAYLEGAAVTTAAAEAT